MFLSVQSVFRPTSADILSRISTAADGAQGNRGSFGAQFSPDGRSVLFASHASNLVAEDTNDRADIFLKNLSTGAVTRLSTPADGAQADDESFDARFSPDGSSVLFVSHASNLFPGDADDSANIFLKNLSTGAVTRLSTAADGAQGNRGSFSAQFSPDGRFVVFDSDASNLVAGDTNGSADVFRVDLLYRANAAAISEGRFLETTLDTGAASGVSIAWGDGTSSVAVPAEGRAAFSHAYASGGTKAAAVTLTEGALTWTVPHTVDVGAATMARNTALADTLAGGAGRDSLAGDAFANILLGHGGNDRLSAGAGNDRLSGGPGQDSLAGGAGRDVFVFDDRETGAAKAKADTILDFSQRQRDRIDLSAIDADTKKRGDQKFAFIGHKSFDKAGQVRFEKAKGATYVYLNTDADKAAEAVIKLKGALELHKSWFVL